MHFLKCIQLSEHLIQGVGFLIMIPVLVLVFLPKIPTFSQEITKTYSLLNQQVNRSFIIGMKPYCNNSMLQLEGGGQFCLAVCKNQCGVTRELRNTSGLWYYSVEQVFFYSTSEIVNDYTNGSLIFNNKKAPMFKLLNGQLIYYYYAPLNPIRCEQLFSKVGKNIEDKFIALYHQYPIGIRYLFYTSIPFIILYLVVFILRTKIIMKSHKQSSKFKNQALYFLIIMVTLYLSIIIRSVKYSIEQAQLIDNIRSIGQQCLIKNVRNIFTNFIDNDGLSNSYTYFMATLVTFIFLMLIGLIVTRILQWRFKTADQFQDADYQLKEL